MMLDEINLTELKKLNYEQLDSLAQEIRQKIIEVVSKNGGHLASNLGIVELTIAIHKVFDSPKDKIIFDVSHQTYAHKILTGRAKEFASLRKFKGLSGFARYAESSHDAFEAGHSSTAISAGLGYLEAKKNFPNEIGEVIAIVGDASIVNGLSFEALNYLGDHQDQKMIIILNDNEMGISKNVGSLAKSFSSVRTKGKMRFIRKITPVTLHKMIEANSDEINLFQSLGFEYFENINGHNIKELVKYLSYAKNSHHSIILHVITKKGKGYLPAEEDQFGAWHGVPPFDIEKGIFKIDTNYTTYGHLLANFLVDFVKNNKKGNLLRVITPAMMLGSGLEFFAKACPEQFIDVGIAEENAAVMAASMAHARLIPILFCYATFLQRAYDEIVHDIARSSEHVIICIDHAGIVSNDGDTHQGIFDLSYLSSIPNITILAPKNGSEALSMLDYAINSLTGPVVIRYSKEKIAKEVVKYCYQPKWTVENDGDIAIITYGILYQETKEFIKVHNLKISLVNASILSRVDEEVLIKLALDKRKIIVYEEVYEKGSLGDAILRFYNQTNLYPKVKLLSLKNTFLEVGLRHELLKEYHISLEDLQKEIGD